MNEQKKVFHIVSGKKERKYAEVLQTLVSESDKLKCDILSPSDYVQNKASSDAFVLFIGNGAETSKNIEGILSVKYNKHGVIYATKGKTAKIWQRNIFWNFNEVNSFVKEYDAKVENLKKLKQKYDFKSGAWDVYITIMFGLIAGLSVKKLIEAIKRSKEIKKAQYYFGVMLFVENELEKFMKIETPASNT